MRYSALLPLAVAGTTAMVVIPPHWGSNNRRLAGDTVPPGSGSSSFWLQHPLGAAEPDSTQQTFAAAIADDVSKTQDVWLEAFASSLENVWDQALGEGFDHAEFEEDLLDSDLVAPLYHSPAPEDHHPFPPLPPKAYPAPPPPAWGHPLPPPSWHHPPPPPSWDQPPPPPPKGFPPPPSWAHPPSHEDDEDGEKKSLYDIIKGCEHLSHFAKLIDEQSDLVDLLKEPDTNLTVFAPTDDAFRHLPHHPPPKDGDDDDTPPKRPSKEFLHAVLQYHISPETLRVPKLLHYSTIPTLFTPDSFKSSDVVAADSKTPQRIRLSLAPSLFSPIRLNYITRLTPPHPHRASNGLIYGLDKLLLLPPPTGVIVRAFPAHFSTFALAVERAGLVDEVFGRKPDSAAAAKGFKGKTLFVPTNAAWARLGPRLNAFLFGGSERATEILKAIIKYHVVPENTVYSDTIYGGEDDGDDGDDDQGYEEDEELDHPHPHPQHPPHKDKPSARPRGWRRLALPTLLGQDRNQRVYLLARHFAGLVQLRVNLRARVIIRDGVVADGVVHVLDRVLIPRRKKEKDGDEDDGDEEMTVAELAERLGMNAPEEEEEEEGVWGEL